MPIGWQLILRRRDDAVLAADLSSRRALARCVARVGRGLPVVAFHAPDGHAHVAVLADRTVAGRLGWRLASGVGQVLGHRGQLEPVRFREVHDQAHARNLFRYVLDQARHHGVAPDPFHEASALPDLVGMRTTGRWMREVVRERLPRVRRRDLVALLGAEPRELDAADPGVLAEAAAAAIGAVELRGRRPEVVAARAAAVQLACPGFRTAAVAVLLDTPLRTVQRLLHHPLPPHVLEAVDQQWRLRSWVRDGVVRQKSGA